MVYSTISDDQSATIENPDHDQLCLELGELEHMVFVSRCLSRGDSDIVSHRFPARINLKSSIAQMQHETKR